MTKNTSITHSEEELYDWLLAQRIRASVDAVEAELLDYLNAHTPGWNYPVTDAEFGHALATKDQELGEALEIWWNRNAMSEQPMTFVEIQAKAYAEI